MKRRELLPQHFNYQLFFAANYNGAIATGSTSLSLLLTTKTRRTLSIFFSISMNSE